ncbi:hypothetical protein [Streptomyces sp. MZ04]|uniref:DUF6907 domain-containing protein n=1 Tax=Streptomyces sp. MZ04 TaxID=2559236 RepID=UPI00107E9154|nr:hypothetical protein [Streptomyces sp. MZ04]TGB09791.1 hypothetical protein E2651_15690 [Streptomyces sp. MZ04]
MSDGHDPLSGIDPELRAWHQGALEGDPAVCGAPQPGHPGFPCIWNTNPHPEHRDVFGRTWTQDRGEPVYVAEWVEQSADGTVTLPTLDFGDVTIPCPEWCTGHLAQPQYRSDLTHNGPVVVAKVETECHGVIEFLQTHLSWAPFAELRPEPYPVAAIEVGDGHDFGPDGVRKVAKALLGHAGRLHRFADDLDHLRDGGES